MPQFGWQPQEIWPQSRSGPWTRSAKSEKVLMKLMGNQSRVGSPMPVWFLTSWARCDRVWRRAARRSSETLSSRPVKETGWKEGKLISSSCRGELDDVANLLVVDAVDDGGDWDDVHAGLVEIVNGLSFTSGVADFTMRVGGVPIPSN